MKHFFSRILIPGARHLCRFKVEGIWPMKRAEARAPGAIQNSAFLLLAPRFAPTRVERMKKFLGLLGCIVGMQLRAQMAVEVRLDQEQFLPGEAMPVAVRIANRSGQTVHLGDSADWLTFTMESADGLIVSKNGEAPVFGEFDLESSKIATKRVDLAPYFNIGKPGRYLITATVHVKNWDKEFSNTPKEFDLIEGTRLWEESFGLPSTNSTAAPEMRKFVLQQANYLRKITLYLRLTDAAETHVIRLFPIGPLLSFSRPEAQVDSQSNLHLLYQNGPHIFSYTIYNANAEMILHRTYGFGNIRPKISRDPNGKVFILGGVRVAESDDFPEPAPTPATNAVSAPTVPTP